MEARYYSNLLEDGLTTQGDVLIEENGLNEVVRYFHRWVWITYPLSSWKIAWILMLLQIDLV